MSFHFRSLYLHDDGFVQLGRYHDDSIAILLVSDDGEPLSTPTVCLSEYGEKPAEGNVFIRDYSQNTGMLNCLQSLGIVGPSLRTVPCGYAEAYECELLIGPDSPGVVA